MTKNQMQIMVEYFMTEFGQDVRPYPGQVSAEIRDLRIRLMQEELDGPGELVESMLKGDLVGVADGLSDLLYVVFGTAAAYGMNVAEFFDDVHQSNMSKRRQDGDAWVIDRDAGGKITKPSTYIPANLRPILEQQIISGGGIVASMQAVCVCGHRSEEHVIAEDDLFHEPCEHLYCTCREYVWSGLK